MIEVPARGATERPRTIEATTGRPQRATRSTNDDAASKSTIKIPDAPQTSLMGTYVRVYF